MSLTPKREKFAQSIADGMTQADAYRTAFSCDPPSKASTGFYVYFLVDPRDGRIFYIGKGTGSRISHHARDARRGKIQNAEKHKRISQILDAGLKVEEVYFEVGLNETEALQIERQLIGRLRSFGLTNIAGGNMSNEELDLQRALALRKIIAPLDWLERNPDPDFIKVFGGMKEFHTWAHETIDMMIEDAQAKIGASHVTYS